MLGQRADELVPTPRRRCSGSTRGCDEDAPAEVRRRRDPAARELAVARRASSNSRPGSSVATSCSAVTGSFGTTRLFSAAHASRSAGVVDDAQLDHPDLFSLPCCFA